MNFTIEDNVPMKQRGENGKVISEFSLTLRKLKVGQSFHVSTAQKGELAIRAGANYAQRVTGRKFCVAKENGGFRVWCIA